MVTILTRHGSYTIPQDWVIILNPHRIHVRLPFGGMVLDARDVRGIEY